MSSMQVSRHVRRGRTADVIETNLRLVHANNGKLPVRRVRLESNDRCPDLRQKVCSRLRADGIVGVPSPWDTSEIIVPIASAVVRREATGDGWHVRLLASTYNGELDLRNSREANTAAELLQKAIVVEWEHGGEYWWLSESTRFWYSDKPAAVEEGVMLLPRLSVSTCTLSEGRLGVAYDGGHLLCTEKTVAEFLFDQRSRQRFEELRGRADGRRGTLIYNTGGARRSKCYFSDFADGKTCETTGVIMVRGRRYGSLHDYYQRANATLPICGDDAVISVSFEWGERPVLVAAKLLRLRLRLDPMQMPRNMRRLGMTPDSRRTFVRNRWSSRTSNTVQQVGLAAATGLWQPATGETTQLIAPALLFGDGKRLESPTDASMSQYRRYFRDREQLLRDHGVYRVNPTAAREVTIVVPRAGRGWSLELQDAFVEAVRHDLEQLTKQRFTLKVENADSAKEAARLLKNHISGTSLIAFDDRELDGAAYYLLSDELRDWTLKRVARHTLVRSWGRIRSARDNTEKGEAEQFWRDTIFHTVLDLLDQMGAIPFRIEQWPYEACLAIDVSEDRRFCALSFLICRDAAAHAGRDGLWRYLDCWTKPDTRRETIEKVQLADKIANIPEALNGHRLTPLKSLLVLRDGHECGDESQAIDQALNLWKKMDVLAQSAAVDVIDYHKRTVKDLRMWRVSERETGNVLEGRAVFLDGRTALTSLTGAATLSRGVTADPVLLVGRDQSDIRRAAGGVFALAQHNWLSPKKAYRDAQPMRDADHELTRRMAMEVRGLR